MTYQKKHQETKGSHFPTRVPSKVFLFLFVSKVRNGHLQSSAWHLLLQEFDICHCLIRSTNEINMPAVSLLLVQINQIWWYVVHVCTNSRASINFYNFHFFQMKEIEVCIHELNIAPMCIILSLDIYFSSLKKWE